jgi:hypothetical protein
MAVRHGYGKIAGADALVFAYDTGDTRNSYRGEPTTNLYGNWNAYTGGSYEVLDNNTNYIKLLASAGTPWAGQFTAAVSAGTYTVSFQHRTDDGGSNNFNIDNDTQDDNIWNANITTTTEWQTYTSTKTHTGTGNHLLYFRRNSGAGNIYIRNVQLELKSHATPFIKGTRSNTQGLLDLTGNKTIDLSNVSFDSNAQMFFDGTDDYIDIPNSTTLFSGTQDFTVEAAYNMEGQGGGAILGNYGSGYTTNHLWFSGQYGIWLDGGVYAPGAPLSNGRYHMVGTRESGVMKLYLNGVLVNSGTRSNSIATDINYRIGADVSSPDEEFTGDIYVVKAYSRALTAAEVRSNYNFYKSRFNL